MIYESQCRYESDADYVGKIALKMYALLTV